MIDDYDKSWQAPDPNVDGCRSLFIAGLIGLVLWCAIAVVIGCVL